LLAPPEIGGVNSQNLFFCQRIRSEIKTPIPSKERRWGKYILTKI